MDYEKVKGIIEIAGKIIHLLKELSGDDERDFIWEDILKKDLNPNCSKRPTSIDLTTLCLPVRNQGNEGICTAMSISALKEIQEYIELNSNEYLSPKFIFNCQVNPQSDKGMNIREGLKYLRKIGIPTEEVYPITKKIGSKIPKKIIENKDTSERQIKLFARTFTMNAVKRALDYGRPVIIVVPVFNSSETMWIRNDGDEKRGYHAMLIVGYDDHTKTFKIRNSWGEDWGKNGYTYISYDDFGYIREKWVTWDRKNDSWKPKRKTFKHFFYKRREW